MKVSRISAVDLGPVPFQAPVFVFTPKDELRQAMASLIISQRPRVIADIL
jgi:hypothetical protein